MRLIWRALSYRLDDIHYIERGDLDDRALAPNRDEFAAEVALDLPTLALSGQLLANEVFANRRKRASALALLGETLTLKFCRRIDSALSMPN